MIPTRSTSIPDIARTLAVSAVVEGSVLRAGDTVRIQVQLIQTKPRERHLWATSYDRLAKAGYRAAMHAGAAQLARDAQQLRARPNIVAILYAHAGEPSQSIDWLYRAVESHDPDTYMIPVADYGAAVRASPRFHELIRHIGIEQ